MAVEQHTAHIPEQRASRPTYFVGRRQGEAPELYAVSSDEVSRVTCDEQHGYLDWRGSSAARMNLAHILLTRIAKQAPSRDLEARFALYALSNLPEDGFVLHTDQIWQWLLATADEQDFLPTRSWAGRLRSLVAAVPMLRAHD